MTTRKITGIIIHCAATPNGRWHNVQEIDQWHQARDFKREEEFRQRFNSDLLAIGYHFIIYPNGAIATGRHLDEIGAHAQGFNSKSIGICLLGTDKFSQEQWESLRENIALLLRKYPGIHRVVGHRDLPDVKKTCPGFNVAEWLAGDMQPLPGHVLVGADDIRPETQ